MKLRSFLFGLLLAIVPASVAAQPVIPLRGDTGVLKDFRPNAAAWLSEDRILMADLRYNNLQVFDTAGRRFRLFEAPSMKAPVQYVGFAKLPNDEYLALGSHYHQENHPRYRDQRSVIHRIHLVDESLEQPEKNLSPTEALRRTRMWGSAPLRQLEFCGMAADVENNIAWFGLAKPKSEKGTLALLRCPLDKLLAGDPEIEFKEVDTGFTLPEDEPCGLPTYLSDIALLDDGSLLLLLTADDIEGKRFCSNSLWRWSPDGGGGATLVKENLALQNRAMGMAVRSLGDGRYKIALVCDNDTEATGLPAGLMVLEEPIDPGAPPAAVEGEPGFEGGPYGESDSPPYNPDDALSEPSDPEATPVDLEP